jgi:hypothetical protein
MKTHLITLALGVALAAPAFADPVDDNFDKAFKAVAEAAAKRKEFCDQNPNRCAVICKLDEWWLRNTGIEKTVCERIPIE